MSKEELAEIKEKIEGHLPHILEAHKLHTVYFMLTDILDETPIVSIFPSLWWSMISSISASSIPSTACDLSL